VLKSLGPHQVGRLSQRAGPSRSSCFVDIVEMRSGVAYEGIPIARDVAPSNQPPSHYQVQFSSNETCEAARQQLIKDAERIGQAMIEGATAQDRQLGSSNKTSLLMTAMANAPYVSGRLFQRHAARSRKPLAVWRESIGAGGKECPVCGLIFAQLRNTKKFCSTRCRQKAFRPTQ
jgi:hypothetical protein